MIDVPFRVVGVAVTCALCACGGSAFLLGEIEGGALGPAADVARMGDAGRGSLRGDTAPDDGAVRDELEPVVDGATADRRSAQDAGAVDVTSMLDAHPDVAELVDVGPPPADAAADVVTPPDATPPPGPLCCPVKGGVLQACGSGAGFVCYPRATSCGEQCSPLPDGGLTCVTTCPTAGAACSSGSSVCQLGAYCVWSSGAGDSWPGYLAPCP